MAKNDRSRRRRQEKKRSREKRLRRERNVRRNEARVEPYEPGPDAEFAGERLERRLALLVMGREFASEAEMEEFLAPYVGRPWNEIAVDEVAHNPREVAQELAFCAMETTDLEEALDFAEEALEIDPGNCDALTTWAMVEAQDEEARIKLLYDAVEAGANALGGEEFFRAAEGQFWINVFTRPYMRTRLSLAQLLRVAQRYEEATVEFADLARLDAEDSIAARYPLIGLHLQRGELDEARELLGRFATDESACWLWARVLERVLADDREGAEAAHTAARKANVFVDALLRLSETPQLSDRQAPGSVEEASEIFELLGPAWVGSERARAWILEQSA